MKMKCLLTFYLIFNLLASSVAQELWSLQRCVDYAIDHSLSLRQSKLDAQQSGINQQAAKQLRIPSFSASSDFNVSYGRQIDPTTNDFINQRFSSQNLSLSGGVLLFNGGRINDQIEQASLAVEASTLDVEQMQNDIALSVAQAYLQILFAQENHTNAQKSLELIRAQLDQMDKFINAGTRPQNARLDLLAQVAQRDQMVITTENDIIIAYLNLKQLLQLSEVAEFQIEVPDISLPSDYDIEVLDAQKVFNTALSWQPSIKAGALRRSYAELGVSLARTGMMPSLNIGGSIGSRYSSFARRQGSQIGTETMTQDIFLNGESVTLSFDQPIFGVNKVSYLDQLNENLAYGVGLGLSVPIYSQGRNKANLQLAQLDVVRTEIQTEQVKNQLKTDIQRAVADVKAGKKNYEAAQRTAEAMRAAYSDTDKRFGLGVANSLEFVTAQNNRDQAETDLIIAKFEYVFRLKVLDFYEGKKLTIN